MTEHLRMGGAYWGLTSLSIMDMLDDKRKFEVVQWVMSCKNPENGSFAPNQGHDGNLTTTHYALLILAVYGEMERLSDNDITTLTDWIESLQNSDGGFKGDKWGEADTRFCYSALACLSILHQLNKADVKGCVNYLRRCRNYDGAFGPVPSSESHAAFTFCAVQALAIANSLDSVIDQERILIYSLSTFSPGQTWLVVM
eukprot:Filipodium_phascolosomae@DN2336_c0_g1_i5.p1